MKSQKLSMLFVSSLLLMTMLALPGCRIGGVWPYDPKPLMEANNAAQNGDLIKVKTFMETEVALERKNNHVGVLLTSAAQGGQSEVLQFLLDHPEFLKLSQKEQRDFLQLALNLASFNGHVSTVQFFCQHPAIQQMDRYKRSFVLGSGLTGAAASGNLDLANFLLEQGAYVDGDGLGFSETPLIFAVKSGKLEIVRRLLEKGADPALTFQNQNALGNARSSNNRAMVEILAPVTKSAN